MNGNQSAEISPIKPDRAESKFGKISKPRKVYVQARYKDKVNKSSITYSFSQEMDMSGTNKENVSVNKLNNSRANLVQKNRAVGPNIKASMKPVCKTFPRPEIPPDPRKLSKIKYSVNETTKPQLKELKSSSTKNEAGKKKTCQGSLDMVYCQYLQSAFLANHLAVAVDTQKGKFLERYQQLESEDKRVTILLNVLKEYKNADNLIKKKDFVVDKLSGSLDASGCLERFCQDLESRANLVAVDPGLDLGREVPGELSVIGEYLHGQDEVIEPAQIEDLAQLEGNLVSVRQSIAEQSRQIAALKELAVSTCTKIVSNVSIGISADGDNFIK